MKPEDVEMMGDQVSEEELMPEDKAFDDGTNYRTVIKEKFYITWDKSCYFGQSAILNHGITHRDQKLLARVFEDVETCRYTQTVILQGAAGVGKTTLLRKAILEWADGNICQQYTYVFYLSGKEVSQSKEKSFAELISKDLPSSEGHIKQILSEPRNILFMIDSFDELDFSFEEPEFALCTDWTQKHPVSFLISSLLRKVMLPESFLVVTTRSTAWKRLVPLLHNPRCVKLSGLSKNARMDYIYCLLKDKTWAMDAIYSIRKNERLFNMCHVYQVCQVVCTCLKEQEEKGGNVAETCQTTTALFTSYICSLFSQVDESCTLPNETLLRSLCQAAAEGIWTMKYILYKKNLRKHELTRDDISVFLNVNVLQEDTEYKNCYAFTHLHVQEFFAALFYLLRENPKNYPIKPFEDLNRLLDSNSFQDPHLEQMKCFLFGLLNKDRVRQLEETFNFTISMNIKGELLMCLEALEKNEFSPSQLILPDLLHCLYETQDRGFITQALSYFPKIAVKVEEETQLLVYSFCLQHCYSLKTIKLTTVAELKNRLDLNPIAETCQEEAVVQTIKYWQDLFSVLHKNEYLREMDLNESRLNKSLMKILNEELCHPRCKLQKLLLGSVCFLDSCHDFSFVGKCLTLTHLDLKDAILEDNGLKSLCSALESKQCKLLVLRLESCDLSVTHCLKLSEALYRNRSLVFLNLSTNNLTDVGGKLLCKIIENPNCHLERLSLANCGLTKAVCEVLSLALAKNKSLTHLCLADNFLEDKGIEILSYALRSPHCTLQSLVLRCCYFSQVGGEFLSTALLDNKSLIHLDLGSNSLQDSGLRFLCHVLQQSTCTLQELELMGCVLTSEGCLDLASVLVKNSHLWNLDLGNNNLMDDGLHILCEALKTPNCRIKKLGLENCGFSPGCCEDLSSLFYNSQNLLQINLMRNALGCDTIRNLCRVLRLPTCKLEFLALNKKEICNKELKKFLNDVKTRNSRLKIRPCYYKTESEGWWQYF
ncbi:NACHT, LRR and PYD domains-containing protein 14 [Cricetulus griseus]|uniref:NACHT, LRR and PYD domains-containing protein 14 n=1 Tax=Cricetulus griseus TaxID=10029 RepID=A0A9J7JVX2_CRIGR|nr:NACHT, LRR and PYD domains-containing protein 14 [Cricetulus griseus]